MKPFNTKINCFSGQNNRNDNFFSLDYNLVIPSFSFTPKRLKMMKMKFGTKMNISKIKGTGHLIAKKDEGLKYTFQINLKATTYFTHVFHFNPFFQLNLPSKKII